MCRIDYRKMRKLGVRIQKAVIVTQIKDAAGLD